MPLNEMRFFKGEKSALCVRALLRVFVRYTRWTERLHQTGDTHTRRGDIIEQIYSVFDGTPTTTISPLSSFFLHKRQDADSGRNIIMEKHMKKKPSAPFFSPLLLSSSSTIPT